MYLELPILFFAGFFGGVLNSIAGGGTFITFPALIFVGLPPIIANATNTFASCFGYLSGTYAFRRDLVAHKSEILKLIFIGIIGGTVGAWLLLQTSEHDFQNVIPWLLTFATIIFITGNYINIKIRDFAKKHKISIYCSVPSQIDVLADYLKNFNFKNSSVKLSVFCGEPLKYYHVSNWKKFFDIKN